MLLTAFILFKKTFLLFHIALLKCFIYSRVAVSYIIFLSNYLLPIQKKNLPQEKSCLSNWFTIIRMLVDETILPILSVTAWTSITLENVWLFLLTFLVRFPPSTNTARFPHSLLMKTSLGKSQYHLVLPQL